MAKFYYGDGYCNIEGSNIRGVQIHYTGAVIISKQAGDSFQVIANNNKIIIFPIGNGFLSELFTYTGNIKVTGVLVSDEFGRPVPTTIKRVMDYAELIDTNAEDMTINSERLNSTYSHKQKVRETVVIDNIIKNQNTGSMRGDLYTKDGEVYSGAFHIHPDGRVMSGAEHGESSVDLFTKKAIGVRDGKAKPITVTVRRRPVSGRTDRGGY